MKGCAKGREIALKEQWLVATAVYNPFQSEVHEQQEQKLSLLSVKLDWMLLSVVVGAVGYLWCISL